MPDTRLTLKLADGTWKVLLDDTTVVLTCSTDFSRTSRSSSVSSADMLAFAKAIVAHYHPRRSRGKP